MRLFIQLPLPRHTRQGFTLVEVLLTVTILLVVLVTIAQFMTDIDGTWRSAAADPFAEAQDAFSTLADRLATATLAPYEDYADAHGSFRADPTFVPDHIARRSDLAFVCGSSSSLLTTGSRTTTGCGVFFLASNGYTQSLPHQGMENLANAIGYVVEFGDDTSAPHFIVSPKPRPRWRLKQIVQPAESLQIFSTNTSAAWLQQLMPAGAPLPVLAENIVTLLVLPERDASDSGAALAPAYSYDSRDTGNRLTLHQLPPRVRIVLVAMDELSASRLAAKYGPAAPPLVPPNLFMQSAQLDADLASLDASLTAQKIGHRLFQRAISLPSSSWSQIPSP